MSRLLSISNNSQCKVSNFEEKNTFELGFSSWLFFKFFQFWQGDLRLTGVEVRLHVSFRPRGTTAGSDVRSENLKFRRHLSKSFKSELFPLASIGPPHRRCTIKIHSKISDSNNSTSHPHQQPLAQPAVAGL
jgi:hypothetical protein